MNNYGFKEYSSVLSEDYIHRKLDFCVADWAYHDNLIVQNSFFSNTVINKDYRKITIKIDYKLNAFDYPTSKIIHGYLIWNVLSCAVSEEIEDASFYQEGYTLDLTMPGNHFYLTSVNEIKNKRDYYHQDAERYWNIKR